MIWRAFSVRVTFALVHIRGFMDSTKSCNVLRKSFLPFVNEHHQNGYSFQQDNDSIHISN